MEFEAGWSSNTVASHRQIWSIIKDRFLANERGLNRDYFLISFVLLIAAILRFAFLILRQQPWPFEIQFVRENS